MRFGRSLLVSMVVTPILDIPEVWDLLLRVEGLLFRVGGGGLMVEGWA